VSLAYCELVYPQTTEGALSNQVRLIRNPKFRATCDDNLHFDTQGFPLNSSSTVLPCPITVGSPSTTTVEHVAELLDCGSLTQFLFSNYPDMIALDIPKESQTSFPTRCYACGQLGRDNPTMSGSDLFAQTERSSSIRRPSASPTQNTIPLQTTISDTSGGSDVGHYLNRHISR
jgi:hypothetical protein